MVISTYGVLRLYRTLLLGLNCNRGLDITTVNEIRCSENGVRVVVF